MLITAWILLVCFGIIGITQLNKFLMSSLNIPSVIVMFISIIISAVSAGIIWGGLFK